MTGRDASSLKWENRWLAKDIGYAERGKQRLWRMVSENWQAGLIAGGLGCRLHMGASRHSLVLGGATDPAELKRAEEDHWFSSIGLLGLLVFWVRSRREMAIRDLVLRVRAGPPLLAAAARCSPGVQQGSSGWRPLRLHSGDARG